jgi:RsiW-degrading membrane proteinase PrsW (M82 family)
MFLAGSVESHVLALSGITGTLGMALVAAVAEEVLKLATVLAMAAAARRHFNDPMDGVIYGSMAGLGMALEESVAHLSLGTHGAALPPAEVVRLCGHLVMGGIGSFGVGGALLGRTAWPGALAGGLVGAISLHFGWDSVALRAEAAGGPLTRHSLAAALIMLSGLVLYGALVSRASRWSHDLLAPSLPARLWGWPFDRHVGGPRPSATLPEDRPAKGL